MAIGLGTAALLGPAVVGGIAGTAGNIISGEYQKKLQNDQQEFAEKQSQNQIKYNVQQMKDLGLSPMMLFNHGNATGGGAGAGSQGSAPDFANAMIAMSNQIKDLMIEDAKRDNEERRIDLEEKRINLKNKEINNQIVNNDLKYKQFEENNNRYWTKEAEKDMRSGRIYQGFGDFIKNYKNKK